MTNNPRYDKVKAIGDLLLTEFADFENTYGPEKTEIYKTNFMKLLNQYVTKGDDEPTILEVIQRTDIERNEPTVMEIIERDGTRRKP